MTAATPERTTLLRWRERARTHRPFALVSPHTNTTNTYIELQKALLHAIGYEVTPLSVAFLLGGGYRHLFDSRNVLVLHWLETRLYRKHGARVSLSPRGCGEFLFYLLVMLAARAPSVYFVHNRAVHDTEGWHRDLSARVIELVARVASQCVVHDPSSVGRSRTEYLPHPLYWDAPVVDRPLVPEARSASATEGSVERRRPVFGILGALRPYKGIIEVLNAWPSGCRLQITGLGADEYVRQLNDVVERRGLEADVSIDSRFITETELPSKLAQIDALLIPQLPNTMLVSGAFFEAIGKVPKILARSSPFMRWAESHFAGVHCFEDEAELSELARAWTRAEQAMESNVPERDRETALTEFGWAACVERYGRFFDQLR